MTLAELCQLQALLEKAQTHAEQQIAYSPFENVARIAWRNFEHDCLEALLSVKVVIDMIEEAMNDEQ
jgi:hypothetical protein